MKLPRKSSLGWKRHCRRPHLLLRGMDRPRTMMPHQVIIPHVSAIHHLSHHLHRRHRLHLHRRHRLHLRLRQPSIQNLGLLMANGPLAH